MTGKTLLIVCALTLSILGIASAKSYSFTLVTPAKVGANELKVGQYEVKVEGSQAVFTDDRHSKPISVSVTIEHSDKKFNYTAVETTKTDGADSIRSITLGGSNTKLVLIP